MTAPEQPDAVDRVDYSWPVTLAVCAAVIGIWLGTAFQIWRM